MQSSELDRLLAGNRGLARGRSHRTISPSPSGPLAVLVCCAELGADPERFFACAPGSLFVVQGPGTLVSRSVLDSVDYGVRHLGLGLVLVLAHTGCEWTRQDRDGPLRLDRHGPQGPHGALWAASRAAQQIRVARPDGEHGSVVAMVLDMETCVVRLAH